MIEDRSERGREEEGEKETVGAGVVCEGCVTIRDEGLDCAAKNKKKWKKGNETLTVTPKPGPPSIIMKQPWDITQVRILERS